MNKQKDNKIIVISGPTATYKTRFSIMLVKHLKSKFNNCNIAIINFDSLLFYKELNIGTAKPDKLEMEEIEHYLIDVCSIKTPLNAHDFVIMAEEIIEKLKKENVTPILVGGSGFYLQALINGMYASESKIESSEITARSNRLYAKHGIKPFRDLLKRVDEESYNKLHENDHYRTRRAVEYYWLTNNKISTAKRLIISMLTVSIF